MRMRSLSRILQSVPPAHRLSLEDHLDGKAWDEIEKVWYVKLSQFDQLMQAASWEYQIQNDILVRDDPRNGLLRVRSTQKGDVEGKLALPEYSLIVKVKQDASGAAHNKEAAIPVSEDFFTLMSLLCPDGMRKDRYNFPVPDSELVFEVDMFLTPEAIQARQTGTTLMGPQYFPWGKIDLELPDANTPVPDLPVQFDELIIQTDDENPNITKLYTEYFITSNA